VSHAGDVAVDLSLAREGARKVLADCLDLRAGNRVSVFYDEETQGPAMLLMEESEKLGLRLTKRFVSVHHQLSVAPETGLCGACRDALDDAAAVITCLNASTETTPYRRELLREGASGTTKVGHIPGASLFVLASAINVDYAHAVARCEDLALALTVGEAGVLTTYSLGLDDQPVSSHELKIELGGFRRMPVVSTGVIPPGTWGNLPGGETFIAPVEDRAIGEIAINGAYKDRVLGPYEALILRLEASRLVSPARGPDTVLAGFDRLMASARIDGDQDYNALAEFGIGVNVGIGSLTGNSLFDEKCAGTIHIALGDSSGFGGRYRSVIHEDLISRLPSFSIDGKRILDRGNDCFREEDWYDDIDTFPIDRRVAAAGSRVLKSAERSNTKGGVLRVNHQVGAGRVCSYRVGKEAQSPMLAKLYNELHPLSPVEVSQLAKSVAAKYGFATDKIARGLSILLRHRLISVN